MKKWLLVLAAVILVSSLGGLAGASCAGKTYDLNIEINNSASGTVDPAVGTHPIDEGSAVDITATAASGYAFSHWSGDASGNIQTITVTMDGDKTITANFAVVSPASPPSSITTSVVSSLNPSVSGDMVTFTATVAISAGGTPTGTVTFQDGETVLGTSALTSGQASYATSALSVGTHTITAVYSGDASLGGSTSAALTQTVNPASAVSTSTSLTTSQSPSSSGNPVTFTATVSPVSGAGDPTGTVTFMDGSQPLGTSALSSGQAAYTISSLSVGSHTITAMYSGDAGFASSTSTALTHQVVLEPVPVAASTATNVVSSLNPSVHGASVTFTATVTSSGASPTGTVTFKDGGTTLGTSGLSSGQAAYSTSGLSAGSHVIRAVYEGNASFAGSTSAALTQVVSAPAPASTATSVTSSSNPSAYGTSVTFTATVTSSGGSPTGGVTFKDGDTALGTSDLNSGQAAYTTSGLSVGSHAITAVYEGNASFSGSTSAALTQTVNQGATTTSVTSSHNPSHPSDNVTLTATVSPTSGAGHPTGTVTFKQAAATIGTADLISGQATMTRKFPAVGNFTITALYAGSADFAGSTSAPLTQHVVLQPVPMRYPTTTQVTSSPNPSAYGASVTLTASVTSTSPLGAPGGTVTFKDGTTVLGTATISSSQAVYETSGLSVGTHTITAVYEGNSVFNGSTSDALTQTVKRARTKTTLTSSQNPSRRSDAVTFTVTVSPESGGGLPTGRLEFWCDGIRQEVVELSSGPASFIIPAGRLDAGEHRIVVKYEGDRNYLPSENALTQTVR